MNLANIASTAELHNMSAVSKAKTEQGFNDDTNVSEGDEDEDDTCLSGVQVLYFSVVQ